jgi:hypothetical protein
VVVVLVLVLVVPSLSKFLPFDTNPNACRMSSCIYFNRIPFQTPKLRVLTGDPNTDIRETSLPPYVATDYRTLQIMRQ